MTNIAATKNAPQVYPPTFGRQGAGGIPLPGAVVGEAVIAVRDITTIADASANFESTISVAGQIRQTSASNLSSKEYWFVLVHS